MNSFYYYSIIECLVLIVYLGHFNEYHSASATMVKAQPTKYCKYIHS